MMTCLSGVETVARSSASKEVTRQTITCQHHANDVLPAGWLTTRCTPAPPRTETLVGNKKPELVACPWCGAKPGERCFTEHAGQRYPLSVRAHASRYEALKTTQERRQQMSTTKFMTATGSNRELHIKRSNEDHVQIRQFDPEFHTHQAKTFFLNPSEAPALCLAILEAAGVTETDSPYMQEAADNLRAYILIEEKVTAEARERAELEAEALELHNAFWDGWDRNHIDSWDDQPGKAKNAWVSAARRAREMRTEK